MADVVIKVGVDMTAIDAAQRRVDALKAEAGQIARVGVPGGPLGVGGAGGRTGAERAANALVGEALFNAPLAGASFQEQAAQYERQAAQQRIAQSNDKALAMRRTRPNTTFPSIGVPFEASATAGAVPGVTPVNSWTSSVGTPMLGSAPGEPSNAGVFRTPQANRQFRTAGTVPAVQPPIGFSKVRGQVSSALGIGGVGKFLAGAFIAKYAADVVKGTAADLALEPNTPVTEAVWKNMTLTANRLATPVVGTLAEVPLLIGDLGALALTSVHDSSGRSVLRALAKSHRAVDDFVNKVSRDEAANRAGREMLADFTARSRAWNEAMEDMLRSRDERVRAETNAYIERVVDMGLGFTRDEIRSILAPLIEANVKRKDQDEMERTVPKVNQRQGVQAGASR